MNDLPEYYFRIRENGAFVFRVDTANQLKRIEMDQIAVVNVKNGEIKPHGDRTLSDSDLTAIGDWLAARRDLLARRDIDDILRTVDHLNLTAHWVQSRATPSEINEIAHPLLMAMHDLRSVLVRKLAESDGA